MRLNRLEEAGHWYRESLRAKADHVPAHLTFAKLLSITVSPTQTPQTQRYSDKEKDFLLFCPVISRGNHPRRVLLKVSSC